MMMVEFIKNLQLFTSLNSGIDMKPKEFFDAVVRMREKQQEYFKTQKKQIPADFRKQMYENYKANMAFYGKPISSYKQWLKDVFNTKIPTK